MKATADKVETFLIDATGFLLQTHRAYVGAPLLVVDGQDQTFLFGLFRDLLRLREDLGIQQGVVVVGEEAYQVTTAVNIQEAIAFLKHLGIAIVADPRVGVIALCASLTPLAKYVVTHDRKLLVLVKDGLQIVLLKEGAEPQIIGADAVRSMFGVTPELLSALFALTDGPKPTVLSKRDALAVLRQSGTVNDTIADPLVFSSRRIRNVITAHRATILQRLALLSPKESGSSVHMDLQNFEISFRGPHVMQLLARLGLYSLRRSLTTPGRPHFCEEKAKRNSRAYHAIISPQELVRLATQLGVSQYCAVDTESSGRDPRTAELFGVSLSIKEVKPFIADTRA